MKNEKFDVPLELDAKILQYAGEKKFNQLRWYRTLPARAAAVVLIGAVIGALQFTGRKTEVQTVHIAEQVPQENLDWNDFNEQIESVANEIADEALYLAQL